jgi:hypothetical protein
VFDKAGVVTIGCNIHDWMLGFIAVVATPYFATTDAKGDARLRDLPAGTYELHAWHPRQRAQVAPMPLALDAGSSQIAAVVIDPAPRKTRFKPPPDLFKY